MYDSMRPPTNNVDFTSAARWQRQKCKINNCYSRAPAATSPVGQYHKIQMFKNILQYNNIMLYYYDINSVVDYVAGPEPRLCEGGTLCT